MIPNEMEVYRVQDEDLKRLPKVKNPLLPVFLRAVSAGVAVVSLERIVESMEPFLGENLGWEGASQIRWWFKEVRGLEGVV